MVDFPLSPDPVATQQLAGNVAPDEVGATDQVIESCILSAIVLSPLPTSCRSSDSSSSVLNPPRTLRYNIYPSWLDPLQTPTLSKNRELKDQGASYTGSQRRQSPRPSVMKQTGVLAEAQA